jgi:hypothetical protein
MCITLVVDYLKKKDCQVWNLYETNFGLLRERVLIVANFFNSSLQVVHGRLWFYNLVMKL